MELEFLLGEGISRPNLDIIYSVQHERLWKGNGARAFRLKR